MNSINQKKGIIRKEMLKLRNRLTMEEFINKNKDIQNLFNSLEFDYCPQNYMSYVNIGREARTVEIIKNLLMEGKRVSVPVCITKTTQLIASQIFDLNELEACNFGLQEPKKGFIRPVDPQEIEIVLVPGLAFDRKGNRLGYGKGYYDGFLAELPSRTLKIGLAYSFQIIGQVPTNHFDIPLDMIITDKEIITF